MYGTLKRRTFQFAVLFSALGVAGSMSLRAAPVPQELAGQSEVAVGSTSQQELISFLAAHIDI